MMTIQNSSAPTMATTDNRTNLQLGVRCIDQIVICSPVLLLNASAFTGLRTK